jgi:hypothetical protein
MHEVSYASSLGPHTPVGQGTFGGRCCCPNCASCPGNKCLFFFLLKSTFKPSLPATFEAKRTTTRHGEKVCRGAPIIAWAAVGPETKDCPKFRSGGESLVTRGALWQKGWRRGRTLHSSRSDSADLGAGRCPQVHDPQPDAGSDLRHGKASQSLNCVAFTWFMCCE